jgi:FlaA1/EpsC-like NDP-sugar epimerase
MSFITQQLITMSLMEKTQLKLVFTNVMGQKNVADLALRHQVEKFVMVSTDRAVNPTSVLRPMAHCGKYILNVYSSQSGGTKQLNLLRLVWCVGS